jgi:hypothetical protein
MEAHYLLLVQQAQQAMLHVLLQQVSNSRELRKEFFPRTFVWFKAHFIVGSPQHWAQKLTKF